MASQPCRLCMGVLHRNSMRKWSDVMPKSRSLWTASSSASTSRVTLISLTKIISAPHTGQMLRQRAATSLMLESPHNNVKLGTLSFSRGMATLTRQPESPEEPEVFSGGKPSIILTDRAIKHLEKVSAKENKPNLALRVAVEPGGCHGYQYKMEMTNEIEDDDFRFSSGENVHLIVDSTSLRLIKGSTIDYVTELIGSQFAILNNPQAKGAGCGCGVSWEPII